MWTLHVVFFQCQVLFIYENGENEYYKYMESMKMSIIVIKIFICVKCVYRVLSFPIFKIFFVYVYSETVIYNTPI